MTCRARERSSTRPPFGSIPAEDFVTSCQVIPRLKRLHAPFHSLGLSSRNFADLSPRSSQFLRALCVTPPPEFISPPEEIILVYDRICHTPTVTIALIKMKMYRSRTAQTEGTARSVATSLLRSFLSVFSAALWCKSRTRQTLAAHPKTHPCTHSKTHLFLRKTAKNTLNTRKFLPGPRNTLTLTPKLSDLWLHLSPSLKNSPPMTANASSAAPHLALGTWHLALGTWHLALGTWHLALGTWHLALGTWDLALGTWDPAFAPRICQPSDASFAPDEGILSFATFKHAVARCCTLLHAVFQGGRAQDRVTAPAEMSLYLRHGPLR
jgi:hypothetical protein